MKEVQDTVGRDVESGGGGRDQRGTVAWISIAPIKGFGLVSLDSATLTEDGIVGDREYAIVDEKGRILNGKAHGELVAIEPLIDDETRSLELRFPDDSSACGPIELGDIVPANAYGEAVPARLLEGPWSNAVSKYLGRSVRLVRLDHPGPDRGSTVTVLSVAALEDLARAGGSSTPLDPRRFRMTFGVEGITANLEDQWVGGHVAVGNGLVEILGHVGRCAVTTHDPETGKPNFETLKVLRAVRGTLDTTERLPFGVWGRVTVEGRVAVGDPIEPVAR